MLDTLESSVTARAYHECQDQSMQHEHGEGSGVQNTSLKTNVQHDEFDETAQQSNNLVTISLHTPPDKKHTPCNS